MLFHSDSLLWQRAHSLQRFDRLKATRIFGKQITSSPQCGRWGVTYLLRFSDPPCSQHFTAIKIRDMPLIHSWCRFQALYEKTMLSETVQDLHQGTRAPGFCICLGQLCSAHLTLNHPIPAQAVSHHCLGHISLMDSTSFEHLKYQNKENGWEFPIILFSFY